MKVSLSILQAFRLLVLRYANIKVLIALAGLVVVLFFGKKLSYWFAFFTVLRKPYTSYCILAITGEYALI